MMRKFCRKRTTQHLRVTSYMYDAIIFLEIHHFRRFFLNHRYNQHDEAYLNNTNIFNYIRPIWKHHRYSQYYKTHENNITDI